MNTNKVIYETGATSPSVNDLILFTDTTRELVESRDNIYTTILKSGQFSESLLFYVLLHKSRARYCNELGGDNSLHIINMSDVEKEEYCALYADNFENWKSEHGYK